MARDANVIDASPPLDRARTVGRTLNKFRDACFQNLYIAHWDLKYLPAWTRGLQVFEGVPEVYPVAMDLIEVLGPGRRQEVSWMPEHWTPKLRRRLCDVAHVARDLIVDTWGWQPGYDRTQLVQLVAERKRTGLPTLQKQNARMQAILDALSPQEWIELNMGYPPFREDIDPIKREQFDRIVKKRLDLVKPITDQPFGICDPSCWASESFANETRWQVYGHIDNLDTLEARWSEPVKHDPVAEAELHDYEERPLIGTKAARLSLVSFRRLGECGDYLLMSVVAERRRVERIEKLTEPKPLVPISGEVLPVKKSRPRDRDIATKCLGAYIEAAARGDTPPTATELAKQFGCNKGTASRAIKKLEDKRKAAARGEYEDRRRDRG